MQEKYKIIFTKLMLMSHVSTTEKQLLNTPKHKVAKDERTSLHTKNSGLKKSKHITKEYISFPRMKKRKYITKEYISFPSGKPPYRD
jgi:hypothetical protein